MRIEIDDDKEISLVHDYELTQKAFNPIDENAQTMESGVWGAEHQAIIDLNSLKGLFFNEDWVFILIDRIASKIASQELQVVRQTIINGKATYEPIEGHPLQDLFWNPNQNQTYYDWMYSIVSDQCISGNGVVWYAQAINQLIHIPIEMVQLDFDQDNDVRGYRIVQLGQDTGLPQLSKILDIVKDQVAHCRRPNPSSALWGLSPFIPGRKSVLFNRYSTEYLNNFYLKGAQPGMMFEMTDVANEKSALRLLRGIEAVHTGRRNQRRNMILPKGVKATPTAHTLADQQLKDYIDQNRETIINILQVPKHELSIASSGSLGSEEYKTALKNFWSGPLKAIMSSIAASLGKLLASQLGKGNYIQFNLQDVEVLQEDLNSKADLGIKLLQTHTLNEVRAKVFNEEPLEGGDALPGSQQQPSFGFGQFSLPTASIDKVAVEEKEAIEPVQDTTMILPDEERSKILEQNMFIFNDLKATKPKWWQQREDKLTKDYEKAFGDIHSTVLNLFSDQIVSVLGIVKSEVKRQGYKSKEFKKSKLKREIINALSKFEERWIDDALKVIETRIELGYEAQLIVPFNLPNQTDIEAVRQRNAGRRQDMAEGRLAETFKNINQTTTEKIFRIIEDAISNSQTIEQTGRTISNVIAENMSKDFSDPAIINNRAMLIAHQEMMTAASLGQAAAVEDAAEVIPNLMKMWIAAGDDRVRGNPAGKYPDAGADHWHLSGVLVPAGEDFEDTRGNKLAFPRDPKGPLEAIMRCRCSFVMVPGDEADSLGIRSLKPEFQNTQENVNG